MAKRKAQPQPLVLPTIVGPVEVSFKSEHHMGHHEIGPVFITDLRTYTAWCKANGQTPDNAMWPFGTMPDGITQTQWVTRSDAKKIAAHYKTTLGES